MILKQISTKFKHLSLSFPAFFDITYLCNNVFNSLESILQNFTPNQLKKRRKILSFFN